MRLENEIFLCGSNYTVFCIVNKGVCDFTQRMKPIPTSLQFQKLLIYLTATNIKMKLEHYN